jgi:hypothetical protein
MEARQRILDAHTERTAGYWDSLYSGPEYEASQAAALDRARDLFPNADEMSDEHLLAELWEHDEQWADYEWEIGR